VFLFRRLNERFAVRTREFAILGCPPKLASQLRDIAECKKHGAHFFSPAPEEHYYLAAFRVIATDAKGAYEAGRVRMDGVIDAYAPHSDHRIPIVAPLCLAAPIEANDMGVAFTAPGFWVYFHGNDAGVRETWMQTQMQAFTRLMPFFDVATGEHPAAGTELGQRLRLAMRLYRAGVENALEFASYGIEFLCKWAALESLVCTKSDSSKSATLVARIPALFPPVNRANVENSIKELCRLRNDASHEAKVFFFKEVEKSYPLSVRMDEVDQLFLAVAGFAIATLGKATSVKELWAAVGTYQAPPELQQARPPAMPRMGAHDVHEVSGLMISAMNEWINLHFAQAERLTGPSNG
jgi:hypothetical protein